MTRLLPLSLTLALFAAISPLLAKDAMPLMIYGVSIGEEKAVDPRWAALGKIEFS